MAKIKFDHTALDNPAFIVRMREISTALTPNPVFAALGAKAAALDTAVNDLETKNNAYEVTLQLGSQQLTERDAARSDAEDAARALASASEGETTDAAELQSGGWHLRDPSTPIGPLPAPQNLSGTGGDLEGEADLHWEPVYGRDTYIAECSTSATGPWTQFYVGNTSSCTATGLVSGQMYYFRVRAVGPLGPGPWSDIAQKRAT